MFEENSARAKKQLSAPITVIIGNPPYSVGQKSGNDNNQNTTYDYLDKSIANTYVSHSKSTLTRNAYDSYIKAFRWSTDRISENGIVCFVSNGSYLDSFRQCLLEDVTHVYVFNLRGNQRTSGELSRKEGGKIFGSGSRTPVAITLLIKRSGVPNDGFIRYHDIGDYLTREEKLNIIAEFGDIDSIKWEHITPNENNDWINQRNQNFSKFIALGDKKKKEHITIFSDDYASGLSTNRDVWVYNFSAQRASGNAEKMIRFYNNERERCNMELDEYEKTGIVINPTPKVKETFFMNVRSNDETKISWSERLLKRFRKDEMIENDGVIRLVSY